MQSRRDQVQAHLFVMGRLASGMLRADPDAPESPASRTWRGGVIGVVVAVLLALVATLYGAISPGGATSWRKPGTLVMVEGSGSRFLFLGDQLHPVLNVASAKLLAGDRMTVDQVNAASLAGARRGGPVGIVGAPDELPDQSASANAPWLACGLQQPTAGGGSAPQLSLAVGQSRGGTPLTDGQAVLVRTLDGGDYLLWHGRRLRLDGRNGAVQALGYATSAAFAVTGKFLNALPAGPDLSAPAVPGQGEAGPQLAGHATVVGQLFTAPSGDHYLLTQGGLTPLTTTVFDLLRGDPRTQRLAYGGGAITEAPIGPQDLAAHTVPASDAPAEDGLPATPPTLVSVARGQSVCSALQPSGSTPSTSITVVDDGQVRGQAPALQPGVPQSCTAADQITVRPGGGALVRALSAGGVGSTLYLVTDGGVKYPLPSADVAKQLGYQAQGAAGVPSLLLGLLPTGPSLDPTLLKGGGIVSAPVARTPCNG